VPPIWPAPITAIGIGEDAARAAIAPAAAQAALPITIPSLTSSRREQAPLAACVLMACVLPVEISKRRYFFFIVAQRRGAEERRVAREK